MEKFRYICETCGREEIMTSDDAHDKGWDYPPRMGTYGVLSPRTCPRCAISTTVYWKVAVGHVPFNELSQHDIGVIQRIQSEPASLKV